MPSRSGGTREGRCSATPRLWCGQHHTDHTLTKLVSRQNKRFGPVFSSTMYRMSWRGVLAGRSKKESTMASSLREQEEESYTQEKRIFCSIELVAFNVFVTLLKVTSRRRWIPSCEPLQALADRSVHVVKQKPCSERPWRKTCEADNGRRCRSRIGNEKFSRQLKTRFLPIWQLTDLNRRNIT
jgi:hypothetical protein